MMDLTTKQRSVLKFLVDYRNEHAMPPSYEEIRREFGFASLNSVRKHLLQLQRKGYIRSPWGNQKRALEIVDQEDELGAVSLPLLGSVAAGIPVESEELSDRIAVPESLIRNGVHFALKVTGDSMIDDGIHEGDVLVVQQNKVAASGQTVVAVVEGEATVKRYYRLGENVELRPANKEFTSIKTDSGKVQIRGIVVGLLRCYQS